MGASRNRRSADPLVVVEAAAERHLPRGSRVFAGLSGGLDSVVLLHILRRLRDAANWELGAIHVNHGISPQAGQWESFCSDLCCAWEVPLIRRRVDVGSGRRTGIEAAARAARYREYAALDADTVALGHHRDDQAETVLLNLLRGSGVRGIGGMPVLRPLTPGGVHLFRPLLEVCRREIQAYARDQRLLWIEDESNRDTGLRRNFIRHEILPPLERAFPGCREALARGAELAAESSLLLDELAAIDSAVVVDSAGRLDLEGFRQLSPERGRNLLRRWLGSAGLRMPDSRRLAVLAAQLRQASGGGRIRAELEGGIVRGYRGRVSIEREPEKAREEAVRWRDEARLPWGEGWITFVPARGEGVSRAALAMGDVVVRHRRGGERLQLYANRPRRTLKNLFQEAGVPPWQRPIMPLLWCGEHLVWVPGIGAAFDYRCAPGEPGVSPAWEP